MLHANFSSVFNLLRRTAHDSRQASRSHGTGYAHLALATHLGATDRGIFFVQQANGPGCQQKIPNARPGCPGAKAVVIVHHRRHDARCPIGRRSDNPPACRIFFIHRHRVDIDEIKNRELVFQRILGAGTQRAIQLGRTALDPQAARQMALGTTAACHTGFHGIPYLVQACVQLGVGAPSVLIASHHLSDREASAHGNGQQFVSAGKRVFKPSRVNHQLGLIDRSVSLFLRDHKATTHRKVASLLDLLAVACKSQEARAIGMKRQGLIAQKQNITALFERHPLFTIEQQAGIFADLPDARINGVRVDAVGHQAAQTEHDGCVGAMPLAGGTERAVQPGLDAGHLADLPGLCESARKHRGGLHGTHRVRRRGPNADLEKVKNTQGHLGLS